MNNTTLNWISCSLWSSDHWFCCFLNSRFELHTLFLLALDVSGLVISLRLLAPTSSAFTTQDEKRLVVVSVDGIFFGADVQDYSHYRLPYSSTTLVTAFLWYDMNEIDRCDQLLTYMPCKHLRHVSFSMFLPFFLHCMVWEGSSGKTFVSKNATSSLSLHLVNIRLSFCCMIICPG